MYPALPPLADLSAGCTLVRLDAEGSFDAHAHQFAGADRVTIGAAPDNDLVVDDDRGQVSRYHCVLERQDEDWILHDGDPDRGKPSTNGTFVNLVRVDRAYLTPGDRLRLGDALDLWFGALDDPLPEDERSGGGRTRLGPLVGGSPCMQALFDQIESVAPSEDTVLIDGETGTGKELVARAIHERSGRAGRLVALNCAAVSPHLIESELFGHVRGAFTGADVAREGHFEAARGGTLLLDEIGELSGELQPKLLRALEERRARRVGSSDTYELDVRILAATNRDLEADVREGRFRQDLFFRLNVARLTLPPLRDRIRDVPLLVQHLLATAAFNQDAAGEPRVTDTHRDALAALVNYHWPGNVRELVNVVERACAYAEGKRIELADLPSHISGVRLDTDLSSSSSPRWGERADVLPFKQAKASVVGAQERAYLEDLLDRAKGNITRAAELAEVPRKTLYRLLDKHGLRLNGDDA